MLATRARAPEAESLMRASTVSRTTPGQQRLSKEEAAVLEAVEIVSGDAGKDEPPPLSLSLSMYKEVDMLIFIWMRNLYWFTSDKKEQRKGVACLSCCRCRYVVSAPRTTAVELQR